MTLCYQQQEAWKKKTLETYDNEGLLRIRSLLINKETVMGFKPGDEYLIEGILRDRGARVETS